MSLCRVRITLQLLGVEGSAVVEAERSHHLSCLEKHGVAQGLLPNGGGGFLALIGGLAPLNHLYFKTWVYIFSNITKVHLICYQG